MNWGMGDGGWGMGDGTDGRMGGSVAHDKVWSATVCHTTLLRVPALAQPLAGAPEASISGPRVQHAMPPISLMPP